MMRGQEALILYSQFFPENVSFYEIIGYIVSLASYRGSKGIISGFVYVISAHYSITIHPIWPIFAHKVGCACDLVLLKVDPNSERFSNFFSFFLELQTGKGLCVLEHYLFILHCKAEHTKLPTCP